jgi:hypothetical protein
MRCRAFEGPVMVAPGATMAPTALQIVGVPGPASQAAAQDASRADGDDPTCHAEDNGRP